MKNFQHFEKMGPESKETPVDASTSMNRSGGDSSLKALTENIGAQAVGRSFTLADRIRNYCLYTLMFILTCHAVFGEIRNGYERNISGTKESLKLLRARLEYENMTPAQRRKTQSAIATLVDHVAYYDLTEGLLLQFKTITPELYEQIDTITDRLGRPVNVFIKFIPVDGTGVKAWGLTYMDQSADDKDAYESEYGKFTVSIKVWIVRKALLVLAHELGHVKYQVPNLASYFEFHKKHYGGAAASGPMGHDYDDPSGKCAVQFGKTFQKRYADFLKISNDKVQSPIDVLARLKKNWTRMGLSYNLPSPAQKMEGQLTAGIGQRKGDALDPRILPSLIKPRSAGKSMFSFVKQ